MRYEKTLNKQVILFGISMGGATALMTAAHFPDLVSRVITDSAPANFKAMFSRILRSKVGILASLITGIISLYTRIFAGYWLSSASAESIISKVNAPTLFIHGAFDGSEHTQAVHVNPGRYWEAIESFLLIK